MRLTNLILGIRKLCEGGKGRGVFVIDGYFVVNLRGPPPETLKISRGTGVNIYSYIIEFTTKANEN